MSEEENQAIKELTEIKELVQEDLKYDDYNATAILDQTDLKSLVIVLNLIEKQQKEIEGLKKYEQYYEEMEEVNKIFIPVDKIKAKIEELYETKQYWTEEVKKILQSLLEKE